MHIEIHIFPAYMPMDSFAAKLRRTIERVDDLVHKACVNKDAAALGKTTLVDEEEPHMILATVDIRKGT